MTPIVCWRNTAMATGSMMRQKICEASGAVTQRGLSADVAELDRAVASDVVILWV
jgi:hypothetical protein